MPQEVSKALVVVAITCHHHGQSSEINVGRFFSGKDGGEKTEDVKSFTVTQGMAVKTFLSLALLQASKYDSRRLIVVWDSLGMKKLSKSSQRRCGFARGYALGIAEQYKFIIESLEVQAMLTALGHKPKNKGSYEKYRVRIAKDMRLTKWGGAVTFAARDYQMGSKRLPEYSPI